MLWKYRRQVLQVIVETGKTLSELANVMTVLPQALVNATVTNDMKHNYMANPIIAKAIRDLEEKFAQRRSGTDSPFWNRTIGSSYD